MKLSRKMSGGELDDRYPIRAGFARRCARAASGQAVAAPPISDMNSRRLMPNIGRSSRLGAWSACRTLNLRQSDQQVLGIDLNCSESTEALLAHVLPVLRIAHHHGGYETAALRNFDPANVAERSLAAVVQSQSITLSARAITPGGMARPSDAAVFRFRASSKTTGCSTGSSAGSAPLKILPTYCATLR